MEENKEIGIEEKINIRGLTPKFSERIQRAQNYYYSENWRAFKKVFEEDKKDLLEEFDLFGNTAIHVATHSNSHILLGELLEMLLPEDRWKALKKKNFQNNTILHEIAVQEEVEMVDVVAVPPPEEVMSLLKEKNEKGETPLFRAAMFGKLKMVKQMVKHIDEGDMEVHLHSSNNQNILHACVLASFFDVALWIITMMKVDWKSLAQEKNENGLTCLQLLARMPDAFHSYHSMGHFKSLIYHVLPEERYDDTSELFPYNRDLESGHQDDAKPPISGLSRINYAFWNGLAKVSSSVDVFWRKKTEYELAYRLAEKLVENDYSWQTSHNHHIGKVTIKLPPILYNVPERKKQYERKKKKQHEFQLEDERKKEKQLEGHEDQIGIAKEYFHYVPLLIAASYGIIEIVELFLRNHPESINHASDDGHNILHMAVKHRQLEIFKLLQKNSEFHTFHTLAAHISIITKSTILHQVARTDFYRPPDLPGAAFQLQYELKWYKRVEKVLPRHLIRHCDEECLTAGDVVDIMHDEMLRDAQSWIKETAQSCSTVAILVATVVFAAAYTIPGGTEGGAAALLGSPVFLFFTIMDIVALSLSLSSVVMFLSILSSPFELWDFHKSLPIRLRIGFAFLFGSLITTMLAFIATILITIKLQWKNWTSTLIYCGAFFPVTVFALVQFPLYNQLPSLLMKMYKKVIKCFSRKGKRKRKYP